jgi:2-polyprenyl-3-methyl-5-hydroxy-6-metoxy-1,4-benzoquinol methylase
MTQNMADTDKLSSMDYWDDVLKRATLPRLVNKKQYSPWLINSFFSGFIVKEKYRTLIEIGAGSSAWLPFLAREYNLKVSGLDYSEPGCRICEENLKLLGIDYDEIICEDIFKWRSETKYDIIISLGVIEHFENPGEILKIISGHLNENGLIITVVPNTSGLGGSLTRSFLPEVSEIHKVITKNLLMKLHEDNGFTTLKNDYTGFFYPMLIPWSVKTDGVLFKKNSVRRKITMNIINLINTLVTKTLRAFRVNTSSRYFSPFVIYVGKIKL